MLPHGARWMASAVDGVRSCGGGGVVASLMYDVRVEYDGSVEYDVVAWSMMWLLFAPNEQKIKKNTT